jgi:hypothetical protein
VENLRASTNFPGGCAAATKFDFAERTYVRYAASMERTPTDLRAHLYEALDHVASTGEVIEINRNGVALCIMRKPVAENARKSAKAPKTLPNLIVGDPDDLINLQWPWNAGRAG